MRYLLQAKSKAVVVPLLAFCAALALPACKTTEAPFVPEKSERAAVYWKSTAGEIAFDGIFARGKDGSGVLQLFKGGPSPALELRTTPHGRARAAGPISRQGWKGNRSDCPAFLAPSFALLDIYISEGHMPEGAREIHAPRVRAAAEVTNGKLVRASAASNDTPSAVAAIFSPQPPAAPAAGAR